MTLETIEELVIGVQSGDERLTYAFIKFFAKIIRHSLEKYHLEKEDNEDVVQQTLMQLLDATKRYDDDIASFRAYSSSLISRVITREIDKIYFYKRIYCNYKGEEIYDESSEADELMYDFILCMQKFFSSEEIDVLKLVIAYNFSATYVARKYNIDLRVVYNIMSKFKKFKNKLFR